MRNLDPRLMAYGPYLALFFIVPVVIIGLATLTPAAPVGRIDASPSARIVSTDDQHVAVQPTRTLVPTQAPTTTPIETYFAPDGAPAAPMHVPSDCTPLGVAPGWVYCQIPHFAQLVWVRATDLPGVSIDQREPERVSPSLPIVVHPAPVVPEQPIATPIPTLLPATVAMLADRADAALGKHVCPSRALLLGEPIPTIAPGIVLSYDPNDPTAVALWDKARSNSGINVHATATVDTAIACASDASGASCTK